MTAAILIREALDALTNADTAIDLRDWERAARAFLAPKPPTNTSTAEMSDRQMFAYFKKTAPVEDARFMLRTLSTLTASERAELEALIANPPIRTEFYRRYTNVQCTWRRRTARAHREEAAREAA